MCDEFGLLDLLSIDKLSDTKCFRLLDRFRSPAAIRNAGQDDLAEIVGNDIAHKIITARPNDAVKKKYELVHRLNIKIMPFYDENYPAWLRNIEYFPAVLFIRGNIEPADETAVAVIGTRGATVYGKSIAERFAEEFAQAGITIISGMARGIDTMAHKGALKKNGRTIAVLGCGVDRCYPPENKKLMDDIIANGAVISEFNINTPPLAHNFPRRNRIVSGLSKAIIAIEAKEKSGVMNTVNWALDQNKDVYAIPGNIYSKTSSGTNRLIKEGAIPITSAQEVLGALGICNEHSNKPTHTIKLENSEQLVWDRLSFEPVYLDILAEDLSQPTRMILDTLLSLEIKGLIKQLPGMMFVKNIE
jgi:DNA processing protein